MTGERGRGTDGVCHGLIMIVRFTEQQSTAVGPRQLRNATVVEDLWLLFIDVKTYDRFLGIVNKVL